MTEELTLATQDEASSVAPLGGSGAGLDHLRRHPLARAEYERGIGKGRDRLRIDTSHLSRFDGTDFVQWFGRVQSGYFVPFGAVMKIVKSGVSHD